MSEDCPNCETDLLVGSARAANYRWQCYGCGKFWGKLSTEAIGYDEVVEWFESRSPDAARLHADRGCIGQCSTVLTHSSEEARNHRYGRCLKCGHEVVE